MEMKHDVSTLQNPIKAYGTPAFLKFLIPSLMGILLFIFPFPKGESLTVFVGVLIDWSTALLGNSFLSKFALGILTVSAVSAIFTKIAKPKGYKNEILNTFFNPGKVYFLIRIVACIFGWMTFLTIGPEFIWSSNTGGMGLYSLLPTLVMNFLLCGMLLPLLLDYGAMEFIGALIRKFMRPLFTVPGRSALDCIASFIGNGTVGVIITSIQYDKGYYTAREAAVIATCFSIVSLPFCLTVAKFIGVDHQFFLIYMSIILVCIILAIIQPRIYPLKNVSDTYREETGKQIFEDIPKEIKSVNWGLVQGIERASKNTSILEKLKDGVKTFLDIWLNLNPMVMFCGTIAMAIARYTPIFDYISLPFKWFLQLLAIPEAAAAAPATIIGFAGMFIPATLAISIESEMTRFFICILELVQLLFISENVVVILRSNIPLSFGKLALLFLQRTIIAIPIIAAITHLVY